MHTVWSTNFATRHSYKTRTLTTGLFKFRVWNGRIENIGTKETM